MAAVTIYSRIILHEKGGKRSVEWSDECICEAEEVIYEFVCPRPGCGPSRQKIADPKAECWIHGGKKPGGICGGSCTMCAQCKQDGYTAYNGCGDGRMIIRDAEGKVCAEYKPKYDWHPKMPRQLF